MRKTILLFIATLALIGETNAQCSPPVYFGLMIHIEDNWADDTNEDIFNLHALQLRNAVDFVKPYGAKFTAECAIPFALGCNIWGDNVLQSLIDSTMGVGSHANSSKDYAITKHLVDNLIGASENRGISGGATLSDGETVNNWVDSAFNAGFAYVDGGVFIMYLQIPQEERPNNVSDDDIIDSLYHDPAPADFEERVHPHRVNSAFTWHTDTIGPILLLTGSLGEIASIAEGRHSCSPSCVLDSTDVDSIIVSINQAISISEMSNKITVVYMHTPLNTYTPQKKHIYQYLFESLEPLVNLGKLEYKTQADIYDSFLACEALKIEKDFKQTNMQIYPNPSNGILHINLQNYKGKTVHFEILNLTGQTILSKTSTSSKTTIDLTQFSKGVYFLRLLTDNESISKKIIIE